MKETQCSPWPWRRWLRPKLDGSGRGFGRGRSGEGRGAYPPLVCGRRWAEGRRQPTGRRRTVSTAAAGLLRRASGLGRAECGAVGSGRARVATKRGWAAANEPEERAPRWGAQAGPPACAAACASWPLWVLYSPDLATRYLASIPWYGDRRRPACAGAQAKDPRAKRGGGTIQYEDAAHVSRRSARRGTSSPDLEAVGNKPARMPRQVRLPVRGAAKPAERPARRRHSGARLSSISAGQCDFDCVFLQKVELCDKNGRYESCR
jgi:hypothetical protein